PGGRAARDPRRADRRAWRDPDRAGARAGRPPTRSRPRRRARLAQSGRRVRGRGPHRRAAPRAQRGKLPGRPRPAPGRRRGDHGSGAMSALETPPAPPQEQPEVTPAAALRRLTEGELGSLRVLILLAVVWTIFG